MPKPRPSEVSDSENWKFIQRFPKIEEELIPLAKNLVEFDHHICDSTTKFSILSFLNRDEEFRVSVWSSLWITIIQTLGLAYTTSQDDFVHTTAFARYLAETNDLAGSFFAYWALRFQFPFAQNKHAEWKERRKVVQPYVFMLEHLVCLFEHSLLRGESLFSHTYLTYEEIILVLMKSRFDSVFDVKRNVNQILVNRQAGYDYSEEKQLQGYDTVEQQFSSRASRFFEQVGILQFDGTSNSVGIRDWSHFLQALAFLEYRKPQVPIVDEKSRILYFESAFDDLTPQPDQLYHVIQSTSESCVISDSETYDFASLVYANLSAEGFYFDRDFVEAFLLSLKTKPFVILSGVSGTGKTALPKAIMRLIHNEQSKPIAVAPDWTDNTDMLGYFNVENEFIIGEFTSLVLEAARNPHLPYFIVLDEMNLARVEYYFAQVLSVMESRYFDPTCNHVKCEDYLFNKAIRDRLAASNDKCTAELADLRIGPNVYIIGTVNIDETTYAFSKKVLDRANVLEINDIDLMTGVSTQQTQTSSLDNLPGLNYFFRGNITGLKELKQEWELNEERLGLPVIQTLSLWVSKLVEFSRILEPLKMNFGFRVRDEVCIYLYHAACLNVSVRNSENWWHKYFDHQLIQKILPRLFGEQNQIEPYIVRLFNLCVEGATYTQETILGCNIKEQHDIIFPKAAKKLQSMLKEVVQFDKPSTSFWTA